MPSSKLMSDLPGELVSEIATHLPLVYRPTTLLSIALTCRYLCSVVVPRLLYRDVRLNGEEQAKYFLNSWISGLQTSEDIDRPLAHYICHLGIESVVEIPIHEPNYSIAVLQKLLELDGLPNLSALTLHFEDDEKEEADALLPCYALFPRSLWKSLRARCPKLKGVHVTNPEHQFDVEMVEEDIFSIEANAIYDFAVQYPDTFFYLLQGLTSIQLHCDCQSEHPDTAFNFSRLPKGLQIFEFHACEFDIFENTKGSLLDCTFPKLRALALNEINLCLNPSPASTFWKRHPWIEHLEIGELMYGGWLDAFEDGMLPNLKYLRCDPNVALVVLPHVFKTLVGLHIFDTFGAQGTYFLRRVCDGGLLPALRSLSIHRHTRKSLKTQEGSEWFEPALSDHGAILSLSPNDRIPFTRGPPGSNVVMQRRASEIFNHSYIAQIAMAAPNLEELELIGTSDESLEGLSASFSLFSRLRRLVFSSPESFTPFFGSSTKWEEYADYSRRFASYLQGHHSGPYSPLTFDDCVKDLANGCVTLETVTASDKAGRFLIPEGVSARIERIFKNGPVQRVRRVKAWGCIVGKEEEW